MDIVKAHWTNPGTSFTEVTDKIILNAYNWLSEQGSAIIKYKDLQEVSSQLSGSDTDYMRNIYSFLRNCDFVQYGKKPFCCNKVFTILGDLYVHVLKMIEELSTDTIYPEELRNEGLVKLRKMKESLIYTGVCNLTRKSESKYCHYFRIIAKYLLLYRKISEEEFHLFQLIYTQSPETWESDIQPFIQQYRDNEMTICLKKGSSCYTYFKKLFTEAGLTIENGEYTVLVDSKEKMLSCIAEAEHGKE